MTFANLGSLKPKDLDIIIKQYKLIKNSTSFIS